MSKIHSIPPQYPFVSTLAKLALRQAGDDPLSLSRMLVLLPSRRSCRMLREAFLRAAPDQVLLLPQMRPLDEAEDSLSDLALNMQDLVDLPPALSPVERRLLLARCLLASAPALEGTAISLEHALRLADSLIELLDSTQIEGADLSRLPELAKESSQLAEHWQITVQFLGILSTLWPDILAERGRMDPQMRINALIAARCRLWQRFPPQHPVIAAGVMWVRPAALDLLKSILALPQGRIILPGLDRDLDAESWEHIGPTHPQYALKRLLERLGIERDRVELLTPQEEDLAPHRAARLQILREALRPAETCDRWRTLPPLPPDALKGVTRIDAPSPREEADVIALILRESLETAGQTAALVTPDRNLVRRVSAALSRWGLSLNDSGGVPLSSTPNGVFLHLVARMVAEQFAPVPTLACLRHPLAAAGRDPALFRRQIRRLERTLLRGVRPPPGLKGLRVALDRCPVDTEAEREKITELSGVLDGLDAALAPLLRVAARDEAPLVDILSAHWQAAENLATSHDRAGPHRLWGGEAGEAAAQAAAQLHAAAESLGGLLPTLPLSRYPDLLTVLLQGITVRSVWDKHPRLFAWGPLESRLVQADVMILAGLNEDTWPAPAATDPWMSRPMRRDFGLPDVNEAIGHAAHDFAQAFAAPRLILTRAERVDGTPTTPSRWLARLDAVLDSAGLRFDEDGTHWRAWQAALVATTDTPPQHKGVRPAPCPPVALRPRSLSVTGIETLIRDPYAIYAKHILKLVRLDDLDADPGAADYGTLLHAVMARFIGEDGPRDAARLRTLMEEELTQYDDRPIQQVFWRAALHKALPWLIHAEEGHGGTLRQSWCEVKAAHPVTDAFTLTARADRIDLLRDGTLGILDYKTGTPPTKKAVDHGLAPQLPLEGWLAQKGAFEGVPPATVSDLRYWKIGKENLQAGKQSAADLIEAAATHLAELAVCYARADTPYTAIPDPKAAPRYNDYDHLERTSEWLALDDGGEAP